MLQCFKNHHKNHVFSTPKVKCSRNNSDWNSSLMLRLKKQKSLSAHDEQCQSWLLFYFDSWHLGWISNWIVPATLFVLHTWFLWWFLGFWNITAWYFSQRGHQSPWAPNLHSGQITITTEFIYALELLAPCMRLTWGVACSYQHHEGRWDYEPLQFLEGLLVVVVCRQILF